MEASEQSQEENILMHLEMVTAGMIKDLRVNNAYASWKNTPKGLGFIKEDKAKFYQGIGMWLQITQIQLIGTDNNELLEKMVPQWGWMSSLLEIKKIVGA